jgi:hypothetical protein
MHQYHLSNFHKVVKRTKDINSTEGTPLGKATRLQEKPKVHHSLIRKMEKTMKIYLLRIPED